MARKAKRPAAASNKKSTSKSTSAKRTGSAAPRSAGKSGSASKSSTASKSAAKAAPVKATASKAQFYFPGPDFDPLIVESKPQPFAAVVRCDTFEEAKHQALDALIEIIDRCEQRLWELKRSASYDEYRRLSNSSGS